MPGGYACNPSAGKWWQTQVEPWGSLASQPRWPGKLQAKERTYVRKQGGWLMCLKNTRGCPLISTCMYTHVPRQRNSLTHTCTHAQIQFRLTYFKSRMFSFFNSAFFFPYVYASLMFYLSQKPRYPKWKATLSSSAWHLVLTQKQKV